MRTQRAISNSVRVNALAMALGAGLGGLGGASASAQTPPDYGFEWRTVGAPGNRATIMAETPGLDDGLMGSVGHVYRLTRTEVTCSQWIEFADAFWPRYSTPQDPVQVTGFDIGWDFDPDGTRRHTPLPGHEQAAVTPSFNVAVRFCNWLHNGKVNQPWAFETGAYDTSTFRYDANGEFLEQPRRLPDAGYWIPSLDEWVKGMYYDPDKNGPGLEGYWQYPTTSDVAPLTGYPWAGGETSAGLGLSFFPVGLYPNTQSPWGLLEGSGGAKEWTDTLDISTLNIRGSDAASTSDNLSDFSRTTPYRTCGFRLASAVPAPMTSTIFVLVGLETLFRRQRDELRTPSRFRRSARAAAALSLILAPSLAVAQTPPDYQFQWATVTHPNNPAYPGVPDPGDDIYEGNVIGRGSVGHVYRISKSEISTADYMEFVNTFSVQASFPTQLFGKPAFTISPPVWGGGGDGSYTGPGRRYKIATPTSGTRPVFGITWREAAMYCNWLHGGKSSDPATLWTGAYDTSTWDSDGLPPYTDAATHLPDAKYWIPTLDEWVKAVYWDPAKQDRDGWWTWVHGKDTPPVTGLPGEPGAETSAGLGDAVVDPKLIRLGSYPDALSPWGLLDTASGSAEWNEEALYPGDLRARGYMGASALDEEGVGFARIHTQAGGSVTGGNYSFRLASAVPSPSVSIVFVLVGLETLIRRQRDENNRIRSRGGGDRYQCIGTNPHDRGV